MTGSGGYQTRPLSNFETSYKKLVKKHYRKNRQAGEAFAKLVEGFLRLLRSAPRPPEAFGHLEPWPGRAAREGFELWKLDFDMPGLRGAAGEGRLIYLVEEKERTVHIVWIYTHGEFEKRPPEKELGRLLREVTDGNRPTDS